MRSVLATVCAVFGKYDCIHFHAEGPAVMTFLTHRLGIRTVVTIHGLDWQRSKWGKFASWYLKLGERLNALRVCMEVYLKKCCVPMEMLLLRVRLEVTL